MYRFLIVDDEAIERDGVAFLIQKFSYPFQIFTQNNGKNALEFLQKNPVDILCADIKMPFMDGLELCAEAKKLYPDICLLLLTAYSDFDYAKRAIYVKADEYLLKPVVPDEFRAVIQKLLDRLNCRRDEEARRQSLIRQFKNGDEDVQRQVMNSLIAQMEQEVRSNSDAFLFSKNPLIRAAADILNREYASDLSLEDLAGRLHVSKGYLSTLFREETGITISQYIFMMRMNRAEHLLCRTSMKINEIAEAVGYHDAAYFGMQFKKLYGMSPAQFRKGGKDQ